ncbi:hypothetical protein JIG36_34775 [Actinoplanes sp. LDG1-06]|uniref:Tetratricopeptide repeat protein n=1 Tax=Paractinoplanes ovalisporus TaxID=2810368 RepID=A0ABS2AMR1_9ACTN|nr:hypothetical protein [Actinoplanes ovalisporus]MBM2620678.1 hypothetical protein [Actinoplanes ovalisporus]
MPDDPTLARINEAVQLHHVGGDRAAARVMFTEIWTAIGGEAGDPLHVCVLAHSMADVQDDPRSELLWDQRALTAVASLTDDDLASAGVPMTVAQLYPSLHLNLADCYHRLGDLPQARKHLAEARSTVDTLADNDYGHLIRDGLSRLSAQISPGIGSARAARDAGA